MPDEMSPRRAAIVAELAKPRAFSPTVRELCDACGLASPSSMWDQLVILRRQGFVDWMEGAPRTIHLTRLGWSVVRASQAVEA